LNPSPERVTDELFQEFFDPRDLVQVKYEMLRRVQTEGQPVGRSAIDEELRTRPHTLATDFPRLWHDPNIRRIEGANGWRGVQPPSMSASRFLWYELPAKNLICACR
jgi:hypothetical protein